MTTSKPPQSPVETTLSLLHLRTFAGGEVTEPGAVRCWVLTRVASCFPATEGSRACLAPGRAAQREVLLNARLEFWVEFSRIFRRISLEFFQKFTAFFGILIRSPL